MQRGQKSPALHAGVWHATGLFSVGPWQPFFLFPRTWSAPPPRHTEPPSHAHHFVCTLSREPRKSSIYVHAQRAHQWQVAKPTPAAPPWPSVRPVASIPPPPTGTGCTPRRPALRQPVQQPRDATAEATCSNLVISPSHPQRTSKSPYHWLHPHVRFHPAISARANHSNCALAGCTISPSDVHTNTPPTSQSGKVPRAACTTSSLRHELTTTTTAEKPPPGLQSLPALPAHQLPSRLTHARDRRSVRRHPPAVQHNAERDNTWLPTRLTGCLMPTPTHRVEPHHNKMRPLAQGGEGKLWLSTANMQASPRRAKTALAPRDACLFRDLGACLRAASCR